MFTETNIFISGYTNLRTSKFQILERKLSNEANWNAGYGDTTRFNQIDSLWLKGAEVKDNVVNFEVNYLNYKVNHSFHIVNSDYFELGNRLGNYHSITLNDER